MRLTFRNCPCLFRLLSFRIFRKQCRCLATGAVVSDCVQELVDRGLIAGAFPDTLLSEKSLLDQVPPCIYAGFDATADSLHIGNLLVLSTLLRFQMRGLSTIALIGEATARLGDPSGLTKERPALSASQIAANAQNITSQVKRIFANFNRLLNVSAATPIPLVLNNVEWFDNLSVAEFFSVVGRHFRLGHMLGKQCVSERLGKDGMNYSEFSYQIFQAYDWLELYKRTGCLLQLGGIDQTGNIHSGHDLISKCCGRSGYGLLVPLLLSSTGEKLGKSAGASLWLSSRRTSPYVFYQHFFNLADSEMSFYYRSFSFSSMQEIDGIIEKHKVNPGAREAQRFLAEQLTLLVHGPEGLSTALKVTEILHHNQLFKISTMGEEELQLLLCEVPCAHLRFQSGLSASNFALEAGCFNDLESAFRVIRQGGFYINGQRIVDPSMQINSDLAFALSKAVAVLRVGRKSYRIVAWK
uniref:Tyrosine--tRNA ligase n=1 Tax=Trichuris muris TaxID=70415 RepID=A0A5S6QW45_TRIMR